MGSTWVHCGIRAVLLGALAFTGAAFAAPSCKPPAPTALLERFTSADCEHCWKAASAQDPKDPARQRVLVLDWIAPAGDAAPMAAAAMSEAATRAGALSPNETLRRRSALAPRGAPQLRVADGPAWNGYIGLQISVQKTGPLPPDAVAYVALVERVPAGSEGSPVARQLVRVLAGPLTLEELASQPSVLHLRAVRLPEGSRPERLASVGWVETAAGTVISAAQSPAGDCATR